MAHQREVVHHDCLRIFAQTLLVSSVFPSSISVGHPLPLSVRLSSLNKQTRSSCQLRASPTPDLLNQSQPVLLVFQICNFLTHRLQSNDAQSGMGHHRNKYGQTPLFNIMFRPSVFAPCDFLSSISISFLPSVIQPLSLRIIGHSAGVLG